VEPGHRVVGELEYWAVGRSGTVVEVRTGSVAEGVDHTGSGAVAEVRTGSAVVVEGRTGCAASVGVRTASGVVHTG
jgi:hypothetical protein